MLVSRNGDVVHSDDKWTLGIAEEIDTRRVGVFPTSGKSDFELQIYSDEGEARKLWEEARLSC